MDQDLAAVQEARELVTRAHQAAEAFQRASQEEVDRIVAAMGRAASEASERLARAAVDETGMGRYEDKIIKNKFSADDVTAYILPLKTCGILRELPEVKVKELAVPMGVVAAVIPTTNPTSTAIYKALIAVKSRNAIVMSPHPRATKCVVEACRLMREAAERAGAPQDLILCLSAPTIEGTTELMRHKLTAIILATGGYGIVKAAYSAGKPAYGVGPGNVPAIIERTANVPKAVADVVAGKSFDYGLLCSAENSLICDKPVEQQVRRELAYQKAVFVRGEERERLRKVMQDPRTGGINTAIVGLPATEIASRAGIGVPGDTRVLVVECQTVGPEEVFSREKLSPVLGFYVEDGWEKCCERAIELLKFGGLGHSLVIHSTDERVIQKFFEEKPAFRILVNTVNAIGAVGYTTGLAPAMSLGPGTLAGSVTSDNITPLHLINIKRLAYETRPYVAVDAPGAVNRVPPSSALDRSRPPSDAEEIARAVEEFLASHRLARRSSP